MNNMNRAFGIINFAGNHIKVDGLQDFRPVGAFSFLGRYRIIDFPISNMSNSGIDNIEAFIRRNLAPLQSTSEQAAITTSTQNAAV